MAASMGTARSNPMVERKIDRACLRSAAIAAIVATSPGARWAADDTSLPLGLQTWEAIPEDPGMRTACSTELRYATTISAILATSKSKPPGVSTVVALLRGAALRV
jgi:hypothetical protein